MREELMLFMLDGKLAKNFPWDEVMSVSEKYIQPPEWVCKGFEVCLILGIDTQYFVDKYILFKDVHEEEFSKKYVELLKIEREYYWTIHANNVQRQFEQKRGYI